MNRTVSMMHFDNNFNNPSLLFLHVFSYFFHGFFTAFHGRLSEFIVWSCFVTVLSDNCS